MLPDVAGIDDKYSTSDVQGMPAWEIYVALTSSGSRAISCATMLPAKLHVAYLLWCRTYCRER